MNILAHLFLTLAVADVLKLAGREWWLALVFGVIIDIDHLFTLPGYLKKHGLKFVKDYHFRTFIQEPIFLFIVFPFCFIINNFIPLLFFSLHLMLDYLMDYEKKPFQFFSNTRFKGWIELNSKEEWGLTLIFLLVYVITIIP